MSNSNVPIKEFRHQLKFHSRDCGNVLFVVLCHIDCSFHFSQVRGSVIQALVPAFCRARASMPARVASIDVVDFTTMACNVSCVLLPSWANVTVRASTAFSVILQ